MIDIYRVVSFVVFVGFMGCVGPAGFTAEPPTKAELEHGKKLYAAAGSCIACHMPDGKGQPNSIPPLAGSEWLNDTDRSIAISLRGLAGPVKVNGERFYSAMPPQLLFNDAELASILTYVNFAWGNDKQAGEIVTEAEVAKARAALPPEVYTPKTLLKAFPFKEKDIARRNGTYSFDVDDTELEFDTPVVYRTFMPGASPAAFAVALPGNQFYCWDAGESRLRYVWTKGGFIKGNKRHWSSNGKTVARFNGEPYYRARSSLVQAEDEELLTKTDNKLPIYDTTEAPDFPFELKGVDATSSRPRFLGYRLVDGYPVFRVGVGEHEIREQIRALTSEEGAGIERRFEVEPPVALTLKLTPNAKSMLNTSAGTIAADGSLALSAKQAAAFTVTILEREETPEPGPATEPAPAKTKGGAK